MRSVGKRWKILAMILMFSITLISCEASHASTNIDGFEFCFDMESARLLGVEPLKRMMNGEEIELSSGLVGESVDIDLFGRAVAVDVYSVIEYVGKDDVFVKGELLYESGRDRLVMKADTLEIIYAYVGFGKYEPFVEGITSEEELLAAAEVFMGERGVDTTGCTVSYQRELVVKNFMDEFHYRSFLQQEGFEELSEKFGYRVEYRQFVSGIPTDRSFSVGFRCDGTVYGYDITSKYITDKYAETDIDINALNVAFNKLFERLPVVSAYNKTESPEYEVMIERDVKGGVWITFTVEEFEYYTDYKSKRKGEKSSIALMKVYTPLEITE